MDKRDSPRVPWIIINGPSEDNIASITDPAADDAKFYLESEDSNSTSSNKEDKLLIHEPSQEPAACALFCELQELHYSNVAAHMEWHETARWVKFEEDVEEGGKKWSKPHVASLSLHALFELKRDLTDAIFLLDVDVASLVELVDIILNEIEQIKHMHRDLRLKIGQILLSRHRHLHEHHHHHIPGLHPSLRRQLSDSTGFSSNPDISRDQKDAKESHSSSSHRKRGSMDRYHSSIELTAPNKDGPRLKRQLSDMDMSSSHKLKYNVNFMKRIPKGAQAANIMVGTVHFLSQPIVVFIRLAEGSPMADLTEVPLLSRFLFILLGPGKSNTHYHEVGRCMSTLFSDDTFRKTAFDAQDKKALLQGIDDFLDEVIVLPPGEWDPSIRIEPPANLPKRTQSKKSAHGLEANGEVSGIAVDEEEDVSLKRTGRLFGGLVGDIRRKAPWYLSDFKDCLHLQCLASTIFIYIAALTPIVTFGGLLGKVTHDNMAAMEGILAGAITGVTFALFAGQPLNIIGSTGPMLVFESIIYKFCEDKGLYFLGFRFWIGMWVMIYLLLIVAFDLSSLVRYITRFTEEVFAGLISIIFIYEAIEKLLEVEDEYAVHIYSRHPELTDCACVPDISPTGSSLSGTSAPRGGSDFLNSSHWDTLSKVELREGCLHHTGWTLEGSGCDYVPDVFLFSVLIFLGTFVIAYSLKLFRNSSFFPAKVREIVGDFNVVLAVIVMVLIDWAVGLQTPKLNVPSQFKPTRSDRNWVVFFFHGNPWWTALAGALPALLATILIFMDQQITAVIVNRKENKFKKGVGYHLDLFVISLQIAVCSLLGLPWFVASTVIAVSHVMSLRKESESSAPGEKPQFLGVRENRTTNLIVGILVGLSVYLTVVFKFIPMPVLYGVFLYMGISSLNGLQLIERLLLVFIPGKYQPDYMYLRHVQTYRVHLFTLIQVICLACLWAVKAIHEISIAFPIMIVVICFIRKGLDCIFTQREIKELDDTLPEQHKREKEDKKYKGKEVKMAAGYLRIPLRGGKIMTVRAGNVLYKPHSASYGQQPSGPTSPQTAQGR